MRLALCAMLVVGLLADTGRAWQNSRRFWPTGGTFITLTWDPSSDSSVIGYVVHVGVRPGVYSETFDVGIRTSFVYPYANPMRRYYFAVTAYSSGPVHGPPSQEVSGFGRLVPPRGYLPDVPLAPASVVAAQLSPCVIAVRDCARSVTLASRPGTVDGVTTSSDGNLWFIEDSRRVYTIGPDGAPQLALVAATDSDRFSALVTDPNFDRTQRVFLEEIDIQPGGQRQVTIAQYRKVVNRLGERVPVVSGLQLPAAGEMPFAVDAAGRVFVAVPSTTLTVEPFSGVVLAFESDGTALRSSRPGSPVLARGFGKPTALVWDAVSDSLWLSGVDERSAATLAWLAVAPSAALSWPPAPEPVSVEPANRSGKAAQRSESGQTGWPLVVAAPYGRLVSIQADGRAAEILRTDGSITSVTAERRNVIYVVSRPATAAGSRILAIDVSTRTVMNSN